MLRNNEKKPSVRVTGPPAYQTLTITDSSVWRSMSWFVGACVVMASILYLLGDPVLARLLAWSAAAAIGLAVLYRMLYPPLQARLTPTTLAVQGQQVPINDVFEVGVERMESFAHLFINTPHGRRYMGSHRNKDGVEALASRLRYELLQSRQQRGTQADIPAELRSMLTAQKRSIDTGQPPG